MIVTRCATLFFVIFIPLLLVCQQQSLPGVPSLESDKYVVRLVKLERIPPAYNKYKFTFDVVDRGTKRQSLIVMENDTTNLRSASIIDGKLVVLGEILGAGDVVTILDLDKGQQVDTFLCYYPQLSDTKKYLVYLHFYPRMSERAATGAVILVYDLHRSAAQNRVDRQNPDDPGFPVFPEENAKTKSVTSWTEDAAKIHQVYPVGRLLWLDHDNKLALMDKQGPDNYLVSVDITNGLERPVIRRRKIDLASALDLEKSQPDYQSLLAKYGREFMIDDLRESTRGHVAAHVSSSGPKSNEQLEWELP